MALALSAARLSAQTASALGPSIALGAPGDTLLPPERMPQALEVRFALSAAPAHLRDSASVYTLNPATGYVLTKPGTNGVSCIVVRSDWQFDQAFRPDIYWPVCYDAEGSATHLRQYLDAAELRAHGMNGHQVYREVLARFDRGVYRQPARAGIAYMLAPEMRGYKTANVPETHQLPHYMVLAPKVTDKDIGGKPYSMNPFMLRMSPGRDDVIIFLVGAAERVTLFAEHKALLADLCAYRPFLCIP